MKRITIMVAVDQQYAIGLKGDLLVHLPQDLAYFKKTTKGAIVVMGRKTYESLPVKPLKNRENIVLTRSGKEVEKCITLSSVDAVLNYYEKHHQERELFVIGGRDIYEAFLPRADRLLITHIFKTFHADTFFPSLSEEWEITKVEATREMIEQMTPFIFTQYEKKKSH